MFLCEDVLMVLKRSSRDRDSRKGPRKPYKYWDVAPIGYETMTPMQYKALQGNSSDCELAAAVCGHWLQFPFGIEN